MQVGHLQRAFPDSADSTRFAPGRRLVPRLVGIGGAYRPRSSVFKERASGVSEFRMKCSVFVLRFYSRLTGSVAREAVRSCRSTLHVTDICAITYM